MGGVGLGVRVEVEVAPPRPRRPCPPFPRRRTPKSIIICPPGRVRSMAGCPLACPFPFAFPFPFPFAFPLPCGEEDASPPPPSRSRSHRTSYSRTVPSSAALQKVWGVEPHVTTSLTRPWWPVKTRVWGEPSVVRVWRRTSQSIAPGAGAGACVRVRVRVSGDEG